MTPNDVKIVADNIDDFIEVPDGVTRLRKAVLTLAVSGKLVPQDKKEGTAEELYKEIQEYQKKKIEGRKKKILDSAPLDEEEAPFEIPKTWKWVRFTEIASIFNGNSINKNEKEIKYKDVEGIPYIATKDVGFDHVINYESGIGIPKDEWNNFKLAPKNSVFVCAEGGSAGRKVAHLEREVFFGNKLFAIHPPSILDSKYVFYYCTSSEFFSAFQSVMAGLIGGVSINKFGDLLLPLPPAGEQVRIVKKVEEVMKQLDELEIKKRERDGVRARLTRSAMHSLGRGESEIAFEQLTELVKTPSDIKELENALLTLAVSGKLVPQSKADGTAENLYNQIQKERTKAENNSTARKKKTKDLAPIADDEIPFEVPASWKWVRLGDCMSISSGDSLSVKDAKEGKYLVYGGNGIAGRHSAFNTKKGTIVIGRVGALCGIAHIVESDAWVTDNAFIVDYPVELIDREYFALVLNYLNLRSTHRGSAQPVISGISVYPTPMPLAPLAEQKRIVKKVEEVMTLINRLKESLL